MGITKEELVALAAKGYDRFEDRIENENPSKVIAEYYKNLENIDTSNWDLTMKDIYELNKGACLNIRMTAKEYEIEDSFSFAKACIAHTLS